MALASTPKRLATVLQPPAQKRCKAGVFDEASETRRDQERSTGARSGGDRGRSCTPPSFGHVGRRTRDALGSDTRPEMLRHSGRGTWQFGPGGNDRATAE